MRIAREADLGTVPPLSPGAVAELVQPDGSIWRYYSVGNTTSAIAVRLGWTQGNVWLREIERNYIVAVHQRPFPNLFGAIGYALAHPDAVHELAHKPTDTYFIIAGDALRQSNLLISRSTPLVDAIIESRAVPGGTYLRLYHFSPTARNKGASQLWP